MKWIESQEERERRIESLRQERNAAKEDITAARREKDPDTRENLENAAFDRLERAKSKYGK